MLRFPRHLSLFWKVFSQQIYRVNQDATPHNNGLEGDHPSGNNSVHRLLIGSLWYLQKQLATPIVNSHLVPEARVLSPKPSND